jgi:isocitrate dehydrogenase (NAD+)
MKLGDGCFVNSFNEIAKEYPDIQTELKQIDTLATKLVKDPHTLDVMVMPNLYGDIISDLCAGLIGGLGLTPSGNIGEDCSVYEAVHGTAPDIAGKNMANPTALLLSASMMLDHMNFFDEAKRIRESVKKVIGEGKYVTRDLGGNSGTKEYEKAVIDNL